jgi:hypothetical protein
VSESVLDGTETTEIPAPAETTTDPEAATPDPEEIRRIQKEIEARQQQGTTEEKKPPASEPEAKKQPPPDQQP